MNKVIAIVLLFMASLLFGQGKDGKYYEMRVYHTNEGKLNDLVKRFNDHTVEIFENNHMTNGGYWLPIDNKDSVLIYFLSFANRDARDAAWKSFLEDPEWQKVYAASIVNGKLVNHIVSTFMTTTDFSPKLESKNVGNRIFELRTYTPMPGKLDGLLARFRNHTLKIFESHGMENITYWVTEATDAEPSKLVYILAHKNVASAKVSWDAFRADPNWIKVKTESELDGKLVEKVESIMMEALPFSKIK